MRPSTRHSVEEQLLVDCARTHIDAELACQIRSVCNQDLQWGRFVSIASHHKVLPLVEQSLVQHCSERVPPEVLAELRWRHDAIVRANLHLASQLIALQQELADEQIKALFYKGPLLAVTVYGSLAMRQFGDLDLLVSPTDFERTERLLTSRGFLCQKQFSWESSFVHNARSVCVDLHSSLLPAELPVKIDFDSLWESRVFVLVCQTKIATFSPLETLLVLCLQTAKDSRGKKHRLAGICDIAESLQRFDESDLPDLLSKARRVRATRVLHFSLRLAKELVGATYPSRLDAQIGQTAARLAAEIARDFFIDCQGTNRKMNDELKSLFSKRLLARHRLRGVVTPSDRDWQVIRLPSPLSFLYYVIRPIRVLASSIQNFFWRTRE